MMLCLFLNSVRLYVTCYISLSLRFKSVICFSFQFENLLADEKIKILLNEPLTRNDCLFLRSLFVPALPGQDTLDFTKVKKEIHRCAFILNFLNRENGRVKCIVQD